MKRLVASVILLVLGFVATATVPPAACAATPNALLAAIRNARADAIPTLPMLMTEAQDRAVEIAAEFSHAGADHPYAEILAWNSYPDEIATIVAVEQWLDSPTHRSILLDDIWTHVGVGVVDVEPKHFFVALFHAEARPEPVVVGIPPKDVSPKPLPNTDGEGCA